MNETGKANRANVSDVYDVFMTEASSTEVRLVFHWDSDDLANGGRRQKRHLEYRSELDETGIRERTDDEILE